MKVSLNWEKKGNVFVLPTIIIDKYIKTVEYDYIKIILFLFATQCNIENTDIIAKELNIKEDKLTEILEFWENENFIDIHNAIPKEKPKKFLKETLKLDKDEYSEYSLNDTEIKFLLNETQNVLGRTINYSECNILVSLNKLYGLPSDVILMLVGYCLKTGKDNFNYIRKVAIDWVEKEIDNHEKAEIYIMNLESQNKCEFTIKNLFGIRERNLTINERKFADSWINELHCDLDILLEAFNRCVTNTGKISFPYINKIIRTWDSKGYKTILEVNMHEGKKEKIETSSYDINEIETMWLGPTPVYKKED